MKKIHVIYVFAYLLPAAVLAQQSTVIPVAADGPFARVTYPKNAPTSKEAEGYPAAWPTIYGNAQRNAGVLPGIAAESPDNPGVSWQYAEARAWPLDRPAFDAEADGVKSAETTAAQWQGNAVGVSVAGGVVYAASSDQFVYALNARTGKLIWRTSPVGSTFMGQPLVVGNIVYVNAGTVGFNYSNVQRYQKTGSAVRGEGVAYNGIYALDRDTGKLIWRYATAGDAMPTPAASNGRLVFSTGAGEIISLEGKFGGKLWQTNVGGMGNMSSPAIAGGRVFVGMASPAFLYALDEKTGRTLWRASIAGSVNTGMGDVSPAVADGIVVTDAVSHPSTDGTVTKSLARSAGSHPSAGKRSHQQTVSTSTTMDMSIAAFDASTGKMLWNHITARGPKPPSFKGGVPMIHDGVVFVGSPVTNSYQALALKTGKLLWTWRVPDPSEAGSGRGPAAYYNGKLYVATGASLYELDPKTGKLLSEAKIGGRFGITGPTIANNTIYAGNAWDWILAVPLSKL